MEFKLTHYPAVTLADNFPQSARMEMEIEKGPAAMRAAGFFHFGKNSENSAKFSSQSVSNQSSGR